MIQAAESCEHPNGDESFGVSSFSADSPDDIIPCLDIQHANRNFGDSALQLPAFHYNKQIHTYVIILTEARELRRRTHDEHTAVENAVFTTSYCRYTMAVIVSLPPFALLWALHDRPSTD